MALLCHLKYTHYNIPGSMNNIYHNLNIKGSKQSVFNAISIPSELENWWPLRCSGELSIGGSYNFYFGPKYDWYGEVVKVELNRTLHIKMTTADDDWLPTTFGFDLEPKKGSTKLMFFHKNWPSCNDHFKHSSFCWALLLQGLKEYVESGIIIPFEKRS